MAPAPDAPAGDSTIDILRAELLQSSHSEPSLSRSYRALFSLKSLASAQPATGQTLRAIQAIAAGFSSPSALLRHEVAYCLGQTRNAAAAAPFLRAALQDRSEDAMCRHEAAEALGALGDVESLAVLRAFRDDEMEEVVVRETCEIAVARLEWEQDNEEKPYRRCVIDGGLEWCLRCANWGSVSLLQLTRRLPSYRHHRNSLFQIYRPCFLTQSFLYSNAIALCSLFVISPRRQISQPPFPLSRLFLRALQTHPHYSDTKLLLCLASFLTRHLSLISCRLWRT
jgi:hypothetical protein